MPYSSYIVEFFHHIKDKPTVHHLFKNCFLQHPVKLSNGVWLYPLSKSLGFDTEVDYTAHFMHSIEARFDPVKQFQLKSMHSSARPVVTVSYCLEHDRDHLELLNEAEPKIADARKLLGLFSNDHPELFASIIIHADKSGMIQMIPPQSKFRTRLGFGNTGKDFSNNLEAVAEGVKKDEHFDFILSLYNDALAEKNPLFRISRMYACLEGLAAGIIKKFEKEDKAKAGTAKRTTKHAILALIGLPNGATMEHATPKDKCSFDVIDVAGSIRNKIFHGTELGINAPNYKFYDAIKNNIISGDILSNYCEIELIKWALGTSNGLVKNLHNV